MTCKQYVVEARDSAGDLVTDPAAQPPFSLASPRQLLGYYRKAASLAESTAVDLAAALAWFKSKGWHCRPRAW